MKAGIHRLIGENVADRPLLDLKGFSATMARNINDLPTTSPHGSDLSHHAENL